MFKIDVIANHKYSWVHGPKKTKNAKEKRKTDTVRNSQY